MAALAIALERLRVDVFPLNNMVDDIRLCFPDTKTSDIVDAIKKGTMGYYGRTYRFSFQEVSLWITEYCKGRGSGGYSMLEEMTKYHDQNA